MNLKDKNVLVLGAGISGISAALTLKNLGASVTLYDSKPETKINKDLSDIKKAGIILALGSENIKTDAYDYLILSPGISINNPNVKQAEADGVCVMSEVEVAYRLCKTPIIAITGTNGKTTTTTLAGEMLKTTDHRVAVGGNIGTALSHEVLSVGDTGWVVAEISSFQLEGAIDFAPHIAAILNITPDHIDRHGSFENYKETKERIFAKQRKEDYIVLNYDDNIVRDMASRAASQVVYFSRSSELTQGVFVKDGDIVIKWNDNEIHVCPIKAMKLFGAHNVENALAACAMAYFAGVKPENMRHILETFEGVEHRIEPVTIVGGVKYYNDSKATNPESSIKALEAFAGHIILIAGGRDKKTDLTQFMELIKNKVDHLILLGEAQERFYEAAVQHSVKNIHKVTTFEESILLAHKLAQPPQVVLLSPACASYDMFKSYEERGKVFKELVRKL